MDFINITSLVLALGSVVFSVFTYISSIIHDRKQATLDAYNVLQNQVFDKLNTYKTNEIKSIADNCLSKEYKEISALMARIEHFSVGVNTKIYDKKTVKRLAGRYIIGIYEKLEPIIIKKRERFKTDKHYDDFEKLYLELKNLYSKHSRKKQSFI